MSNNPNLNLINYNTTNLRNTQEALRTYIASSNWYNNNTEQINKIIQAINQNLAMLDFIQNQVNITNNINQEALIKQAELLRLENEDLNNQLKELESIQSSISNKERLIEQTNLNMEKEQRNVRVLTVTIIFGFLVFIAVALYGANRLDKMKLGIICCILVVAYLIFLIYAYNLLYFRDAISYMKDIRKYKLQYGSVLKQWGNVISDDISAQIKNTWIDNNCDCAEEENTSEETEYEYISQVGGEDWGQESSGYFYNDGSAPPQLIIPQPTPTLSDKIDWVDYSSNGSVSVTQQGVTYNNNNYYNYNPRGTSENNILIGNNPLVGSQTYTTNL
jgi:hypothetical protein